jgi:hypothetical protein
MARPKMTEQQKADAKAAREAAKANAPAAADRAEARAAAGKPTTDAPKATAAPRGVNPEFDQEERALFLQHLPTIKKLRAALHSANGSLRAAYKTAKAEGAFTKKDFDVAIAVETAENEAKERAKIARALKIAKMCGSSLGNQLDMFLEPDRTPLSDRAFEEGESDAMQNIAARPSYDPSTEAYRRYLDGFHSVSERRIKEGMGTLHPEVEADLKAQEEHKAEMDALKARDAKAFESFDKEVASVSPGHELNAESFSNPEPSSGVPLTRKQFKEMQEAAKVANTKH